MEDLEKESSLDSPKVDTPKVDSPQVDSPQVDSPQVDSPQVDTPQIDSPQVDSPQADTAKVDTPKADTAKVGSPQVDSPKVDTPQVDTPKADTPQVGSPKVVFERDDYAGFWLRVVASSVDYGILSTLFLVVYGVLFVLFVVGVGWFSQGADGDGGGGGGGGAFFVVILVVGLLPLVLVDLLYYSCFESSRLQATPGKKMLGLRVCDREGKGLSFWKCVLRHECKFLSCFLLGIGFFMAGFTKKKQCLHDMCAGAVVVRRH